MERAEGGAEGGGGKGGAEGGAEAGSVALRASCAAGDVIKVAEYERDRMLILWADASGAFAASSHQEARARERTNCTRRGLPAGSSR